MAGGAEPNDGLPASWRKVPSKRRKGEFSYLHLPTGLKQKLAPTGARPPAPAPHTTPPPPLTCCHDARGVA